MENVLNDEQCAAARELDALYAKYGCELHGMWAFEGKATREDLEKAYRLRQIVWGEEAPCCELCGGVKDDCTCGEAHD